VKKAFVLVAIALIGLLAWLAAGTDDPATSMPMAVPRAMGATPAVVKHAPPPVPDLGGEPMDTPPVETLTEPEVPHEVIAPIATETSPPAVVETTTVPSIRDADAPRAMIVPVAGIARSAMRDMFNEARGGRRHEAIDILAPRGTPVIATGDGVVKKLFTSKPGGLTVYQFDPDERFCYYYAHLDRYAAGLHEGQVLHTGDLIGYVGTTGNAPKDTPHLHFALIRLDPDRRWWKGTYVNPYPRLAGR
jgi:peptidoglycan LD-endopeptidase LytH